MLKWLLPLLFLPALSWAQPGPQPGITQLTGDCAAGPGTGSQAIVCTKINGKAVTLGGAFTTTGGVYSLTFTLSGNTNITLPTSGTLVTTTATQTLTNKSIDASEVNSGILASAQIPTATSSLLGGVKPDNTTITNTAGVIRVTYGTATNTAAQGNDTRITGALQATNNLSDVASAATSRTNLGIGGAAVLGVGNGLNSGGGNINVNGVDGQILAGATPALTFNPVLGDSTANKGSLGLTSGTTNTTITIQNILAASSFNFNLPATAGTSGYALLSGGGGSAPMTWGAIPASPVTTANGGLGADNSASSGVPLFATGTVTMTSTSGTGNFVRVSNATMIAPALGAATATSINKVAITAPASSATLTIADGKTLTISNTLTFTGTDASSVAFGAGGTVLYANQSITLSGDVTGSGSTAITTTVAKIAGTTVSGTTGSGNVVFSTNAALITPSIGVATGTGLILTGTSANILTAGRQGSTTPAFNVDASTATNVTGLNIKAAAAAAGLAVSVTSSGTDENLTIDAKGAGTITFGGTSTGAIVHTRATTLSAALTYGGVTLTNAVSGTGPMLLGTAPTITGTAVFTGAATSFIPASGTSAVTIGLASTGTQQGTLTMVGGSGIAGGAGINFTVNATNIGIVGNRSMAFGGATTGAGSDLIVYAASSQALQLLAGGRSTTGGDAFVNTSGNFGVTNLASCNSIGTSSTGLMSCTGGLASGSSTGNTVTGPSAYFICTASCTVTPPVPVAGYQFCIANTDNASGVITLAALGSSARYEATARTSYGTAGTGTFVSGGAVGDLVCLVGLDATHYLTLNYNGTWTAN